MNVAGSESDEDRDRLPASPAEVPWHPPADARHLELARTHRRGLRAMAALLAFRNRTGIVTEPDVDEAQRVILAGAQRSLARELAGLIGGALFGAFLSGFIDALGTGDQALIVSWVVCGGVGLAMSMWSFLSRP